MASSNTCPAPHMLTSLCRDPNLTSAAKQCDLMHDRRQGIRLVPSHSRGRQQADVKMIVSFADS